MMFKRPGARASMGSFTSVAERRRSEKRAECLSASVPPCLAVFLCLGSLLAAAGEPAGAAGSGRVTVLNSDTLLRSHLVFRTPVMVGKDGQTKPVPNPKPKATGPMPEFRSAAPAEGWTAADFDDAAWERDRAPVEAGPEDDANRYAGPSNSMICARAKFTVADPGGVRDLKLSLEYVGGVVIYVNGRELARGHMPSGEVKPETPAEKYPDDLYCLSDGKLVQMFRGKLTDPAAFERRFRKLSDVEVPAGMLRKGVNVLAVEVRRAPINEAATVAKRSRVDTGMGRVPGIWAYAGLKDLILTAAAGSALSPNVGRPAGLQVWNCAPYETVTAFDYGDGGELRPVRIASPRNGVFSGRLVVSSDQAIRDLKVSVSELASADGARLPASAVEVRCAEPFSALTNRRLTHRYNALAAKIPAEIPVVKARHPGDHYPTNYMHIKYVGGPRFPVSRERIAAGALAPLWITVRVPKDAAPGSYKGTAAISAAGLAAVSVPVEVEVSAWTLPDPAEFRITSFGQHSPDSLARHYKAPLWSDRHFELMGRSMALMAELNSRQALAELAIDFYGLDGNRESMVRWIRNGNGTYKHDYSVLDRYLDTVAEHMGKPALLRLNCWGELRPGWGRAPKDPVACWQQVETGKAVSLLDPASGKLEPLVQPVPGTAESLEFWKPVLDEIRKKVEARGWLDVTAMGHNSYNSPAHPTVVGVFKKIWPDGVWSYTAHNGVMGQQWSTSEKGVTMLARYADCVWTRGHPTARGYRALLEPRPGYWCYTFRTDFNDGSPLSTYREVPEEEIMSGHDGVSDFGVDFFPFRSDGGKINFVGCGRGTGGPTCTTMAILAPGPDGPVASERYEMLREGLELGEAILFLERSLREKKVSGELAGRANRLLDERGEVFMRRWPGGRLERDRELLRLAGEVAAAAGAGK